MDPVGRGTPSRLSRLATRLINQAAIPANRLVTERLAAVGARRHHYALLAALLEKGPGSQAGLSDHSAIDRGDVVKAIDELVEQGLVERKSDPSDRRRNVVTITQKGRTRLRQLDQVVAKIQEEFLAALSIGEREELVRLLSRVVEHHTGDRSEPALLSSGATKVSR